MEYTESQQDREPIAGETIPYEDYSVAATTEEEGDEKDIMTPNSSRGGAKPKKQQQQSRGGGCSRKRRSSSSNSSRSSSSSSSVFSSLDDSVSDGGERSTSVAKKKKRKKKRTKAAATQQQKRVDTDNGDRSINKLISVALKSQKKQYKNQIIQSVKSDLMNTLRSRIVQQQRGKKKGGAAYEDGGGEDDDTDGVDSSSSIDKQYRKRIKQAYKEHEEGYDDAPKFNSKQHKKTIGSILSKLGEVNDIELFRIPHIDREMGLDKMEISGGGEDNKLSKKMLSASPEKTIPEAVYAALKDAYSSCMCSERKHCSQQHP